MLGRSSTRGSDAHLPGRRALLLVALLTLVVPSIMADDGVVADAREAFVYGFPIVDNYKVLHDQALDPASSEYKGPPNTITHTRRLATPEDRAIVAPNVDTPYSHAWLDLAAEPVVLGVPAFESDRYVSVQLIDGYTYIVGYVTPRTHGNEGGDFLVAGPDWKGTAPAGIDAVFRAPTRFVLALYRTQLFNEADLVRVHALQDGYRVTPLSHWLGDEAVPAAPIVPVVEPVDPRGPADPERFFAALSWMLAGMPTLPGEESVRGRIAGLGVHADGGFDLPTGLGREQVVDGMRAGLAAMGARARTVRSSAELFGSREFLGDDYLIRAVAAMIGIYGNAEAEYLGVGYQTDSEGRPFDGRHRYRIRFAPGSEPPVQAFWSITAYDAARLLYANPIERYAIGSRMLPDLHRDPDGGYTLYVQHDRPVGEAARNWLPVPATPFGLTFRTYLPGPAIREGRWSAPAVVRIDTVEESP
jgi:hypothetical protein